jgi:FG-GAP repeat
VGAQDANSGQGAVYVFHAGSQEPWSTTSSPTATLTNGAGGPNNNFGSALAVSGDGTTAIVGSVLSTNSSKGAAYVFHVPSETSWASSATPTATLTDSASAVNDDFGVSVTLSNDGTTAIVGTNVDNGVGSGYADIFRAAGEGSWSSSATPTATLTDQVPAVDNRFGYSVSLSSDGTTALIGAPGTSTGTGTAFVYRVAGEASWATTANASATLTNVAESHNQNFGAAVTLSGNGTTALIGGAQGTAALFQMPGESSWSTSDAPTATLLNGSGGFFDFFGLAVGLSSDGSTALVGAAGVNSDTGAAYIFEPSSSTPPPPPLHGYWLVGADGGIFTFGSAVFHGSTGSLKLQRPVVGITPTGNDEGYWLAATDGGVFAFGNAGFAGSIPGLGLHPAGSGLAHSLNAPIVGMVPSTDGDGYFMVSSDGGVFAFGDARFEGSCPGIGGCAGSAVAVMPDAGGNGYWVVTATGHVYAFGDAPYYGAPGPEFVPVVSASRTPDGRGYWILYSNGVVVPYGDAVGHGGPSAYTGPGDPATTVFASDNDGYWVATASGGVFTYGDAPFDGSMTGTALNAPIIAASGF